jgi:hypothetical protein
VKKERPLKSRVKKVISICGRKFDIEFSNQKLGGEFHTIHADTKSGKIIVGVGFTDEFYTLSNFLHEIIEVVLTLRELRYVDSPEKIIFAMTHEDFAGAVVDITRAILDTGLITVKEPGVK